MQTQPDTQRRTLDIPEVAERLGICRSHAYDLASRDALPVPVVRLGRRLVVSKAALDAAFPEQALADSASDAA